MASFKGWADAWGNSWGSTVTDPNAMSGSASFSITGSLQVASGEMQGNASFGITATLTLPEPNLGGGTYEKVRKKVLKEIAKRNAAILADEAKATANVLVKSISKQAVNQVNEEDEEEVLMLLLA